jgi:GNAT superfamily N-acetyltransferase
VPAGAEKDIEKTHLTGGHHRRGTPPRQARLYERTSSSIRQTAKVLLHTTIPASREGAVIPFSLRPAQENEIVKIADFQTACWQEAYRGILSDSFLAGMSRDRRREQWSERLATGEREIIAAWDGEDVAGVVSWTGSGAGSIRELKTLYVGASYRKAGLGTELLHRSVGAGPAQLWVFEANVVARVFYTSHGFAATGDVSLDEETDARELLFAR